MNFVGLLWIFWGLAHIAAGAMIYSLHCASAWGLYADSHDQRHFEQYYNPAVKAFQNQHAFNLACFGIITAWGGLKIFAYGARDATTVWGMCTIFGGIASTGYLIFMISDDHVKFIPGILLTIISYSAILLSLIARVLKKK